LTVNTQKNVRVLAGPTGGIKGVHILAGVTGASGQFAQWKQTSGALSPTGTFETVYVVGATGPTGGFKTVIIDGYTGPA
jgi:hypothetical protein